MDIPKFDFTEPIESWVVIYYKGKNCPNNVTKVPQIRWYHYSKLKHEFNNLPPKQAALKYDIYRNHYVTLVLQRAYLAIKNLNSPLGHDWKAKDDVYVPIMFEKTCESNKRNRCR